ncbi:AraC family transcriptional regulator [Micromonospora echinospora]|uniref:AraC-type DNA-binding protein n=1 Tax=Micromonospora echinospora TaxID=1877 RepID=A0A1C4VXT4_MICEC|nr:AraC family transcriptional regulator [Micromonospora echinospora]OZV80209.1 AraC family transcriptional regulator [Micromonospora echinospora]SCE88780.1 AraC-type DNA-binding protein [Micromonospora echinospora]
MRHEPRSDNRGILDPGRFHRELRFRRHLPAAPLRRYVEHYWFVDWSVTGAFEQRVVPHPAVNLVFRHDDDPGSGSHGGVAGSVEVSGVGQRLFSITLAGAGRVCGVQFRPGGFRPFWRRPVAELTGRRLPLVPAPGPAGVCAGDDDDRRRALDDFLLGWAPEPDASADEAMRLADEIRTDRGILRVDDLARRHGVSTRRLQRLFLDHVGVGPKWVIRRYRLQEAIERAAAGPPDWAALAADLGYSDQAHLVRDFTAVTGVTPTAYVRSLHAG